MFYLRTSIVVDGEIIEKLKLACSEVLSDGSKPDDERLGNGSKVHPIQQHTIP